MFGCICLPWLRCRSELVSAHALHCSLSGISTMTVLRRSAVPHCTRNKKRENTVSPQTARRARLEVIHKEATTTFLPHSPSHPLLQLLAPIRAQCGLLDFLGCRHTILLLYALSLAWSPSLIHLYLTLLQSQVTSRYSPAQH